MKILSARNPVPGVRQALQPHLPDTVQAQGVTASQLDTACGDYVAAVTAGQLPSIDPYGPDMSTQETVQISESLGELAQGLQTDFAAKHVAGASLRLGQLENSFAQLERATQLEIDTLSSEKKALKSGYNRQVGKTIAWMAGTAGALLIGGMIPNPISVVVVGAATVMTIRSLNKSRAAHKELSARMPALQANLKASEQLLADTVHFAPHLGAWNSDLSGGSPAAAA